MREAVLDFTRFDSADQVHAYLKETLAFPEYYGFNLDALYDLLSVWSEDVKFYAFPEEKPFEKGFLKVIGDAAGENPHIHIETVRLPE